MSQFQKEWKKTIGSKVYCYDTRHFMMKGTRKKGDSDGPINQEVFKNWSGGMSLPVLFEGFCNPVSEFYTHTSMEEEDTKEVEKKEDGEEEDSSLWKKSLKLHTAGADAEMT